MGTAEEQDDFLGWARHLDMDRRTVTWFLKYLCKRLRAEKFTDEQCVEKLQETFIQDLVSLVLPLDRANCLYHMEKAGRRGQPWFAEEQMALARSMGIDISRGHFMNKFYLYFRDRLDDEYNIYSTFVTRQIDPTWFEPKDRPHPDQMPIQLGGSHPDNEFLQLLAQEYGLENMDIE